MKISTAAMPRKFKAFARHSRKPWNPVPLSYNRAMRPWKEHKLLEPGARVAEFRLPLLDRSPNQGDLALSHMVANGPAVLAFFKISCPVCQLTFPYLERIHSSSRLPVFGISQNNAADTRDFTRRFGITFPILLDSRDSGYPVSNAFGISHVPTLFVAGPGGVIERVTEGWLKSEIGRLGEMAGVDPFEAGGQVPESKAG
ncbi:MAG TPA: TlpA disulfide reductase family protein [Bryobacteraceae bacterium]|nr:TlpA disulfide reductase family protein [Bryobacteraceae bacterium]